MKRKAIADANADKATVENERDELREALNILEEQPGTGMRQYYGSMTLRTVHEPHV